MALSDRPLGHEELRRLLTSRCVSSEFYLMSSEFYLIMTHESPEPHTVLYTACVNEREYISPSTFPWHLELPRSPSDCVWIVPGTLERRL